MEFPFRHRNLTIDTEHQKIVEKKNRVRRVTVCTITDSTVENNPRIITSFSVTCHTNDQFKKAVGSKLAIAGAFENLKRLEEQEKTVYTTKEERAEFWSRYFNGKYNKDNIPKKYRQAFVKYIDQLAKDGKLNGILEKAKDKTDV